METTQIITLSTPITALSVGDTFVVTVTYNVSDGDNTLGGVGINVHFDSSELQFVSNTVVASVSADLIGPPTFGTVLEDDDDGDTETDREVSFGFFNLFGNFPNQSLPLEIATLTFTTLAPFDGTSLNIVPSGNTTTPLQGAPLVLNPLDGTAPIITVAQSFSYVENQGADFGIGTVAATDNEAVTEFEITSGNGAGFFAIDNAGNLTLTATGAAAMTAANDFETGVNSFTLGITAKDAGGNTSTETNVTVNVTDADEIAPIVTPGQAIEYTENQDSGIVLGTIAATDAVGVTGFAIASGDPNNYFAIDNTGKLVLTAAGVLAEVNDFEAGSNGFTLGITASDSAGNVSGVTTVTVSITDVDDTAPVIALNQIIGYSENQAANAQLGTIAATDNVGVTSFTLVSGNDGGFFSLDNAGNISLTTTGAAAMAASNDFEITPNSFTLGVLATDALGNSSAITGVTLQVTNIADETAPVITANQSFDYGENQAVNFSIGTVEAIDAFGATGFAIASGNGAGFFAINNAGEITLTAAGVAGVANDFETTPNSFTLGITATDATGNTATETNITLNVTDVDDEAPVVTPGQSFNYPETQNPNVPFAQVNATDNGTIVSFAIVSGNDSDPFGLPNDSIFAIDNAGNLSLTFAGTDTVAAWDFETAPNTFTLGITATDNEGNTSAVQTVTLNVTDVDEVSPVVDANQTISYVENQTVNAVLGTVTASDDIAVTGYAIASGNDSNFFNIDATGQITITAAGIAGAANDFETTPNRFTLGITASDATGKTSAVQTVSLVVIETDDINPVVAANQTLSYAENQTAGFLIGDIQASDNASVTGFNIASGNGDGFFEIDDFGNLSLTAAGAAAMSAANDFELTPNSFTLGITASDGAGNTSAITNVTVSVTDVDDTAPVVTANQSFNYQENRTLADTLATVAVTEAVGVTSYAIATGNEAGFFTIDSTGKITLTEVGVTSIANDFDSTPNSFVLGITASDAAGNTSITTNITLNVTDVDDVVPVVIPGQDLTYNENRIANTTIVTVAAVDNGTIANYAIASGNSSGFFAIDSSGNVSLTTPGAASVANDFEMAPNSFVLGITATDTTGNVSTVTIVTVNVADVDDVVPVITPDQIFNYLENQTLGATLGSVAANDNVAVTDYAIASGDDGNFFAIDAGGNVTLTAAGVAGAANDFETGVNTFNLGITARDAAGNISAAQTITLNLGDADEINPTITAGQTFDYVENQSVNGLVARVAADDNVAVTGYAIVSGNDSNFFAIDAAGNVTITAAGVAGTANSVSANPNSFALVIRANDAAGNTSTDTSITLTVVNQDNEAPIVTPNQTLSYTENQTANTTITTIAATDNGVITAYAIATGNEASFFAIDNVGNVSLTTAGVTSAANDFETAPNSFVLGIIVTDGSNQSSAITNVTLTVTDVDDVVPVVAANQNFSYQENQAVNFQIGTVTASDNVAVTDYAIASGNDEGFFAIDNAGNLTLTATGVTAAANDAETGANSFNLDITATDAAGNVSLAAPVVVSLTDANEFPISITSNTSFSVAENTTAVGTITTSDGDVNPTTTFSIAGGVDAGAFTLDANTGALSFQTAPDFENPTDSGADNIFNVQVQATDGSNVATQDLTINVTDVDDGVDPLTGLTTEVYRFYRPGSNAHLYTSDLNEVAFFRTRPDVFSEEGVAFRAGTNDNSGTLKAVRRFYNSQTDGHFFTLNEVEIAIVQANQVAAGIFRDEGIAFYALENAEPSLGSDVFRFSNVFTGAHFFTNSIGERDAVIANQVAAGVFRFEGVGWEGGQP